MPCTLSIEPQADRRPRVSLTNCNGFTITALLPASAKVEDDEAGMVSLVAGPAYLNVHADGTLEFASGDVEYYTTISRDFARAISDALRPLRGRAVTDDIEIEDPTGADEDPQVAGRRKKQTRRRRQKLSRKKVWSSS
jgi:hypothetical protein